MIIEPHHKKLVIRVSVQAPHKQSCTAIRLRSLDLGIRGIVIKGADQLHSYPGGS